MENNVMTHIAMFGNTKNIMQNEGSVSIERLDKIKDMLFWNKHKIDAINSYLSDSTSFVHVFHYQQEYRDRLKFNHKVRARLIGMWNDELNKLKL